MKSFTQHDWYNRRDVRTQQNNFFLTFKTHFIVFLFFGIILASHEKCFEKNFYSTDFYTGFVWRYPIIASMSLH